MFFQNPFAIEYIGSFALSDRQYSVSFKCPANSGRSADYIVSWQNAPYNLSGNDDEGNAKSTLWFRWRYNETPKIWNGFSVNISAGAASTSAVTPYEIVDNLNNNATFANFFTAEVSPANSPNVIKIHRKSANVVFYVTNIGAETALRFNERSGVSELPSYFARHTIDNLFNFDDCSGSLILLDESDNVDADVIDNAKDAFGNSRGLDSTSPQEDYQLFEGKSGLFLFSILSTASASSTTTEVLYHAGAKEGDLAKKIITQYDGSNTVLRRYELPYTLESADLIPPP